MGRWGKTCEDDEVVQELNQIVLTATAKEEEGRQKHRHNGMRSNGFMAAAIKQEIWV